MVTDQATGGQVNYYVVPVPHPRRKDQAPYNAECEDIISELGMTFDEGCEFKAIWRTAAARKGKTKPGHSSVYDAEKRVHYAQHSLNTERNKAIIIPTLDTVFKPGTAIQLPSPDDGWIKWDGKGTPPNNTRMVIARLRSGLTTPPYRSGNFDWRHSMLPGDILEYKMV
jgi:hypothetical protein